MNSEENVVDDLRTKILSSGYEIDYHYENLTNLFGVCNF